MNTGSSVERIHKPSSRTECSRFQEWSIDGSPVGLFAVADAVDGDGVAGFGVAVHGFRNLQHDLLPCGADFLRDVRLKADFLRAAF